MWSNCLLDLGMDFVVGNMVFVLRQIQEKCREQNMGLYAVFIDLTKAFDTVSRVRL